MFSSQHHTPSYKAWLASLKVGDTVKVSGRTATPAIVSRVTKTLIGLKRRLDGPEFGTVNRDTGDARGQGNYWDIDPWTQDDSLELRRQHIAQKVRKAIEDLPLSELSLDALVALETAIEAAQASVVS